MGWRSLFQNPSRKNSRYWSRYQSKPKMSHCPICSTHLSCVSIRDGSHLTSLCQKQHLLAINSPRMSFPKDIFIRQLHREQLSWSCSLMSPSRQMSCSGGGWKFCKGCCGTERHWRPRIIVSRNSNPNPSILGGAQWQESIWEENACLFAQVLIRYLMWTSVKGVFSAWDGGMGCILELWLDISCCFVYRSTYRS